MRIQVEYSKFSVAVGGATLQPVFDEAQRDAFD